MEAIKDFNDMVAALRAAKERKRVAVACPEDGHTRYVVARALDEGLANFHLVTAGECGEGFLELAEAHPGHVTVMEEGSRDLAAERAVSLVREGAADVLMKGTINTDNLLRAVLDKSRGLLERGRVLAHLSVASIPSYGKLLVFTDAAVIPCPTLEQFDSMVRYAVGLCHGMGIERPKVALVHCTEKVSEKFPCTLHYVELAKRCLRGDYGEALMHGPIDVKTACDAESGTLKGIASPVVGDADILIFPDIEAGNAFYKTITLFGGATMAGVLAGTMAPVVVTSRADSNESKYFSLALACLN